jgi:hypothetical protein
MQIEAQPREHSKALCDRGCNDELHPKCPCPLGYGRDELPYVNAAIPVIC